MTKTLKTLLNLEGALAGESMAHVKYRFFARVCRAVGDEATAKLFEATADQEILHAFGHLELLLSGQALTPAACLTMAIAGETHEYTEMYPTFLREAQAEGQTAAAAEIGDQIDESREHAHAFGAELSKITLEKAQRRFAALTKVEERHATHYRQALASTTK